MKVQNIIIPYTPLPFQLKLHEDTHRFRAVVAGRRVGKTTAAVNELIRLAITRNLPVEYWYVAPFIYQAKNIAWVMLLKYIPKELLAKLPNESDISIDLVNGAKIGVKGADNPSGLEGIALGGVVIDEVSAISHFNQLWEFTIRPMLSDYESPAIFISKPRGFNHFHDLVKRGDHNQVIEGESGSGFALDKNFITFRFETEQNCREHNNGYIPHEEIEAAKRQLSPEAFDQEYRARFTKYTGLVHKLFDKSIHVIPDMKLPSGWRRIRGWDFGSAHPTASIRLAIDDDGNTFVEKCYKQKDKNIDYHAERIREQDADLGGVVLGYGDPSGRQWISELNNKGISIYPAKRFENTNEKNWGQFSIDKINSKLEIKKDHTVTLPDNSKLENAPSFFILNRPENRSLIDELETLSYKEDQNGINNAIIDDSRDRNGHYDLHAALRYATVSEGGQPINFTLLEPDTEEVKLQRSNEDAEIKTMLKDEEKRKPYELEADLKLIKEQNERRLSGWW